MLDEPTNDLDVETLDLLQELLDDYQGTVILVSHDRDFLDRVATTTIAMEGEGRTVAYAGGWSDYQNQRQPPQDRQKSQTAKPLKQVKPVEKAEKLGLTFTERHRLDKLPAEIERLEAEIAKLEVYLSEPDLYQKAPLKFEKASAALVERQNMLRNAEEEWLALEEKDQA